LEYIVTALEDRHFRPAQFKLVNGDVLPPGLLFPVYFYTVKIDDAVRVPSNALFSGPGGLFVHRMVNGELVHTEITIIARSTTLTAVAEGLEVGDEVFVRP
ncbi:MAG: efflux RND transporter periplasmic adaptor subunit, partial [Firmicutes bacterium]|nr:efflux RND transporter periplasmic adaptor subunit [Bacillota bacterium]